MKIEADDGLYRYSESFPTELNNYLKHNYDIQSYEIDFKKLARQRKDRER